MASISKEKRSGKYRVLIRKRGLPTISKTFTLKGDAVKWARDIEGNREKHIAEGNVIARSMTLSELLDEYMSQWEGRDNSTLSRLAWWRKEYGHKLIGEVDKITIRKGMIKLAMGRQAGGHNKKKEINGKRSNATLNRYLHALSGAFKYAVMELDLPKNPVYGIAIKKEPKGIVRYLSDNERKNLLLTCRNSEWERLYILILLAITTGARRGELMRLRWSDIDIKRRTAIVHHTKNDERKLLNLTSQVVAELMTFREVGNGLLFPSSRKSSAGHMAFDKYWKEALQSAGIDDFRFHDLRHTAASYFAMAGIDIHEIATILGHKQLEVTRRYVHLSTEHRAKTTDRVMGEIHE